MRTAVESVLPGVKSLTPTRRLTVATDCSGIEARLLACQNCLWVLAHAIAKQAPLHALQAIRVGFEHCFSSDINKSAKLMVLLNRAAARSSCFQPVACVLVVSVSCVV